MAASRSERNRHKIWKEKGREEARVRVGGGGKTNLAEFVRIFSANFVKFFHTFPFISSLFCSSFCSSSLSLLLLLLLQLSHLPLSFRAECGRQFAVRCPIAKRDGQSWIKENSDKKISARYTHKHKHKHINKRGAHLSSIRSSSLCSSCLARSSRPATAHGGHFWPANCPCCPVTLVLGCEWV